ncbi:MAG TPA: hypothetical protein VN958_01265 [Chitinophagaceae bacterium]|nr:hypothetical protein [Chitinophagaceae bacterium]
MRILISILIIFFLPAFLFAQQPVKDSINTSPDSAWSFSATGYYYFVPADKNTLTLVGYADYKALHLERRYDYEDQNTASMFGGWRFETGNKVQFGVTPMIGILFGNTNGLAPGLELELNYKILDFYSESEYVTDLTGNENNFFYTWSELGIKPCSSFRAGISVQSTRLYKTKLDVQRGLFGECSFWKLTLGVYYFNPFSNNNFFSTSASIDF